MKIRFIAILASFISIVAVSKTACADPMFDYNSIFASYRWTHFDDNALDSGNGLDSAVTWSPIENFFLEGGYDYLSVQNEDVNLFKYGLGGYYNITDSTDLVGHVGGLHQNVSSSDDDGVYAGLYLRSLVTPKIELDPSITYQNKLLGNKWTYGLRGYYNLGSNLFALAEANINNESDVTLLGGLRYDFGCL